MVHFFSIKKIVLLYRKKKNKFIIYVSDLRQIIQCFKNFKESKKYVKLHFKYD